jgi:aryl-alcohol dehydrogenase-like predicted oxidoreductase
VTLQSVVLGTAQFGAPYGRRRNQAVLPFEVVEEIVARAWSVGVRVFDTAEAYGDAAARLARVLVARGWIGQSHVVTKLPPAQATDAPAVTAACARFHGAASITILSHGPLSQERFALFAKIAQDAGMSAGQSVYAPDDVHAAAIAGAARIQAPANVLDVRNVTAAHEAGVPFDARSVFLQGILLEAPEAAEARVPQTGRLARAVREGAAAIGVAAPAALVAAVLTRLRPDDRVVLGVDDPAQIADIAAAHGISPDRAREFTALVQAHAGVQPDAALLDPRTWT